MFRFLSIIFLAFVAGMVIQLLVVKQGIQTNETDGIFRASSRLDGYAKQVMRAAAPGPHSREFVLPVASEDPISQVATLYRRATSRWNYVPDPEDSVDWLRPAEQMLVHWDGDCEDFAILLASLLQSLPTKIDCRIVLAGPTSHSQQQHAYVEVRLCNADEDTSSVLQELKRHWDAGQLSYRRDAEGLWLALDGGVPPQPHSGRPVFAIYPDGRVAHFEGTRNVTSRSDTKGTLK